MQLRTVVRPASKLLATVALFAACGMLASGGSAPRAAHAETPLQWVGRVAYSDAFVGILVNGPSVTAYVCDGTENGVSIWGWFSGELIDGRAEMVSTNGLALELDTTGGTAAGSVITREGTQLGFQTEAAAGNAGIWRAQGLVDGAPVLAGWILLNGGEQRGASVTGGAAAGAGAIDPAHPLFATGSQLLVVIAIIAILIGVH